MQTAQPPVQYSLFFRQGGTDLVQYPQHTFGHLECPACNAIRDRFMYDAKLLRSMSFKEAAKLWLEFREPHVKAGTLYENKLHIKRLEVFFGEQRLNKIHLGHLKSYQECRGKNKGTADWFTPAWPEQTPWPQPAGASLINHEISTLQQILKHADLWSKLQAVYKPLRQPQSKNPKTLTDEEEMIVFTVAAQDPEIAVAYWVASITNNTGAAGSELRLLRLYDINVESHTRTPGFIIRTEIAKNEYRTRFVPLNPTALKQMKRCIERAKRCGSTESHHHLFPYRKGRGEWNPEKPASESWLRRGFDRLKERTGYHWLTPHIFRHQNITLRLESGEPIELVAKAVGHRSINMTRYYTHSRDDRQMEAVNRIDPSVRYGPLPTARELMLGVRAKNKQRSA